MAPRVARPRHPRSASLSEVIQGIEHRPLIVGRTLFDYADEVSSAVPQSCRRTGRCRECVVEVRQGFEGLSPRTLPEAYLKGGFRLACQATIETATTDIDFAIIRRRMRILESMEAPATRLDPVVTADDTAVFYAGQPIGLRRNHVLGLAIDIGTTTVVFRIIDLLTGVSDRGRRPREPAALRRQRRDDPHLLREGFPGRDAAGRAPRAQPRACATCTASTGSTDTRSTRRSSSPTARCATCSSASTSARSASSRTSRSPKSPCWPARATRPGSDGAATRSGS